MRIGHHVIKTWSSTQQIIALSSGEAELYAMTRGAAQTKGLISMLEDFGLTADAKVHSDASAAIGIAHRRGLGKTRHIQVQYLWVQAEIAAGRLAVKKVGTHENTADLLTKALPREKVAGHLQTLDFEISTSRAATALDL